MRKITLAALAGAAGLLAATPSFAFTTYQVQTDGANAAQYTDQSVGNASNNGGFNFSMKSSQDATDNFGTPGYYNNVDNTNSQQAPSRDMGWQGTGYYLRPNN
ncbi:hypothetical protein F2P47_12355 [Parvibaculum sedimenti]|uniref:Curlin n=1 Tax=Parvibaculum sedimenti TaxID=2608632 RepID=A0A6N6VFT6_9HYPH|nr:hypothetical protein [Parvibaculum sedimenti]KAB7739504.1 hypothetical protein F2P47_12355 [Parvibaculum sedimenti]